MKTLLTLSLSILAAGVFAQAPTPQMMVVQAANAPAATATPATTAPVVRQDASAMRSNMQTLEQMKEANIDTLKRQEAIMAQLDELQKAADQIKIFSHRTGG